MLAQLYSFDRKIFEKQKFQKYLKSAKEGNAKTHNKLGKCYQDELGVTKDEEKHFNDEEKAFQWYSISAE
ncbi:hypothetical protein Glove_326g9 [Diversispora epigaea]|uniref:Uncharacterized protein n=1 Tax=Diversispora epigaea TaxID=1348612 RepID=A0A397HMR3_9GLOM|nr:hypothetical protein Glove_326g9 [Diversispora epigaea]